LLGDDRLLLLDDTTDGSIGRLCSAKSLLRHTNTIPQKAVVG
jgi:hypothetical protein